MSSARCFRHRLATLLVAAALVGVAAAPGCGCAASGFDGQVYRTEQLAFRLRTVPAEWRSVETEGALLAFRDPGAGAMVAVGGRCGKDGDDVPLPALTHHLFLHFTEREVLEQRLIDMDGREALRSELLAKLDGVPRRVIVVVLKKDGCVYDFMLVAAPPIGSQSIEGFDAFVAGFSTVEP